MTLLAANNYANGLLNLGRFEEAKSLMRKTIPVAQRILGESDRITLTMRKIFAEASYKNPCTTLDDLREAATTLEDVGRIAQRVFGGGHPLTGRVELRLREARAMLGAREGDDVSSVCDGVAAMTPRDERKQG